MAFTDEEKNAIYAVEQACFADCWTREMLFEELDSPLCAVCTFSAGGTVAGYALGRVAADEAELFRIGVTPSARRQGVGMRLLKQLHAALAERGAAVCFLEVRSRNLWARTSPSRRWSFSSRGSWSLATSASRCGTCSSS